MFAPGLAPSQPDWVSTMEYQGEEVEPESGILSDKYFAEGHSYDLLPHTLSTVLVLYSRAVRMMIPQIYNPYYSYWDSLV